MIIKNIEIEGVGGIANNLKLFFNPQVNIICGQNGVGKTTILEAITNSFLRGGYQTTIKRNVKCEKAEILTNIENEGNDKEIKVSFDNYFPLEYTKFNTTSYNDHLLRKIISLKISRLFDYKELKSINRDPDRTYYMDEHMIKGIPINDLKDWFVNRFLYSAHNDALTSAQLYNFEKAKKCFSILNSNFIFKTVNASSNDIMLNTPSGEIYYEYLSSGFKSTLSILFGIIKEIEFRNNNQKVDEFDGIILIDEVELHLHPEWQERIMGILTEVFPKVQFFVTTHSPHILQNAEANQIIPLYFDEDNQVYVRDISNYEYGFQGWTIEEILTDIMGMKTLRTELYTQKMKEFEKAVDEENYEKAKKVYIFLNKILHPNSELRKLLEIQLIRAR